MASQRDIELAVRFIKAENTESLAVLLLEAWLHTGHLERALDLPKVHGSRFEFHVPGGRIDLLLFHEDGGMTILEAKGWAQPAKIASGIGQLFYYASVLPSVLSARQQPKYLRKMLVAPVSPQEAVPLLGACQSAGVDFRPLPTIDQVREIVSLHGNRGQQERD
jgi:hypothetical protein